jgi:putative membrane protein
MRQPSCKTRAAPVWPVAPTLLSLAMALAPGVALADDDGPVTTAHLLASWDPSPDLVIPTVLVLGLYGLGLARRPGALDERPWRHAAFFWGVMAVFLSLVSPLDAFSDHLFFVHQIQHMLLREVGPMLIALSQPQALLIAGLPAGLKRRAVTPLLTAGATRGVFGFLTRPVPVTAIFLASLYVWQWPPLHNRAILDEGVHYVMHVTMLAAGLLFFWRVFDHRPMPQGTPYGTRLMMLWIAVLANIPIGAYTTFKSRVLYPAYAVVGRPFAISPIADERLGGFIMWAPCSMMMLFAVLLVVNAWARHEARIDDRRIAAGAAWPHPTPATAEALIAQQRPKNRALALGLCAFAACILAATVTVGLLVMHGRMGLVTGARETAMVQRPVG